MGTRLAAERLLQDLQTPAPRLASLYVFWLVSIASFKEESARI